MSIANHIKYYTKELGTQTQLVAVSKTKPVALIEEAYEAGQRIFGENKAQEMSSKYEVLPKDIEWHMIGHLQRNKVKYIAPFVSLIHSVDSQRLLEEINKRAGQCNRCIDCLLQVHIADEETKFGFGIDELHTFLESDAFHSLKHIRVRGLMGMGTNGVSETQNRAEFARLKVSFDKISQQMEHFDILSIGMSGDYKIAIEEGSTMVRIGSAIFGARNYQTQGNTP